MSYLIIFGILAGVVSALSYFPYIRDIAKGSTKPERASWLIWSVLTILGFFSQLAVGATYSLWLPGIQSIGVIVVFLLSLKFGYGGLAKRDTLTLIASGIILVIWYFTQNPLLATYLIILIDGLGGVLTVMKSYEDPGSETISTWIMSGTGGLCAMIAVGSLDPMLLPYPLYVFVINFAVVAAIILGKRRKRATIA